MSTSGLAERGVFVPITSELKRSELQFRLSETRQVVHAQAGFEHL